MVTRLLLLCIASALPLPLVAQSSPAAPMANRADEIANSDKSFLQALIEEDISEINLANIALQKTSDPQVKQYAQSKILAADPAMRDGAEKIALEHGLQVPSGPGARKQSVQDEISKKSGRLFDNAYMNYEADQQAADLKLVETEIKSTRDPELTQFASAEKTPVQEAAEAAVQLNQQIASSLMHYKQDASETSTESKK